MALGKAITGGTLSFAAVAASEEVAQTLSQGEAGVFMHGPTFMANPLACAVAVASFDVLMQTGWQANVRRIEAQLKAELEGDRALRRAASIADVRVLGAIGVIELREPITAQKMQRMQDAFVRRGLWLRPFGRNIYIMPPYIIGEEELGRLIRGMKAVALELG
jgi:adenosylmethionine-8-amino-7-oxononanoate aminotransferase